MGRMKEKLMDAVYNNMNLISNHFDGEAENFITGEMETIMADLDKVFQKFAILKETMNEVEETMDGDIWEHCCNVELYGADEFEEWWETLEKIEDIMD